jgi:hypothetical protein
LVCVEKIDDGFHINTIVVVVRFFIRKAWRSSLIKIINKRYGGRRLYSLSK